MRILGIDCETSGLSPKDDHLTEIAWVIKDHGDPKPLVMRSCFVENTPAIKLSAEIQDLTKITPKHLELGIALEEILISLADDIILNEVDLIAAHNGEDFDKPFLLTKSKEIDKDPFPRWSRVFDTQWVDTAFDIIYPPTCKYNNLMYVAAYHGFISPFPHAALFDVMTMLKVLDGYDITKVEARAKSPWVIVQALVSFDDRQQAKDRRYSWETIGDKTFPKKWVRKTKELDLGQEVEKAPFKIAVVG